MLKEDILKLPLAILKDIKSLEIELNEIYKKNAEIIVKEEDKPGIILSYRVEGDDGFSFSIAIPETSEIKIFYTCTYKPQGEFNLNLIRQSAGRTYIESLFVAWVDTIKELFEVRSSFIDPYFKNYKEEFFSEFEFISEEDDNEPYNHEKQLALYDTLSQLQLRLENQEQTETVKEALSETIELKENIQNLSKAAIKIKVAKILARIKKGGIKLFKDVIDVAYKELIKAALINGAHDITHLLS